MLRISSDENLEKLRSVFEFSLAELVSESENQSSISGSAKIKHQAMLSANVAALLGRYVAKFDSNLKLMPESKNS